MSDQAVRRCEGSIAGIRCYGQYEHAGPCWIGRTLLICVCGHMIEDHEQVPTGKFASLRSPGCCKHCWKVAHGGCKEFRAQNTAASTAYIKECSACGVALIRNECLNACCPEPKNSCPACGVALIRNECL